MSIAMPSNARADGAAARRTEWPTVILALAVYTAFGTLTWFHADLPWWVLLPAGAYLVALHGSLQHEVTHGHPTRWSAVNRALVLPSLWLWIPYPLYRATHLAHHDDGNLTTPGIDPESYYVTPDEWRRLGALARAVLWLNNTLLGRLSIGPAVALFRLASWEIGRLRRGGVGPVLKDWAGHAVAVTLVLAWVVGVCGMPLWAYLALFVYPGISLSLIRSFLEHQAHPIVDRRTVIVESGPLFALLFLNNNLHVVHHRHPGLPWYALPAAYRRDREAVLAANGGYRYRGYAEVILRYLLWPKEAPVHPGGTYDDTAPGLPHLSGATLSATR
jgi:fatty acid desaturase